MTNAADLIQPKTIRCTKCGFVADAEVWFVANVVRGIKQRRTVCIGCTLTDRNDIDEDKRWIKKVTNSRRHHAKSLGISISDLQNKFGWLLEQMAHDAKHAFQNGCPYCRKLFSSMANGMSALSFDRIDPTRPPYYSTNIRCACFTCNREKATLKPDIFSARLLEWPRWEAHIERLQYDPLAGLPLFDRGMA